MTEEAAISDKELDPNSTRGKIARFSSLLSQQIKNNWQQNYPPESRKHLRSFSSSEVSDLIGVAPATLRQMSLDNEGPQPARSDGNRRMYTLDQINELRLFLSEKRPAQSLQFNPRRRKNDGMQIVAIANFKGGCAKTTTALHLAQFLALQGLRVLAIDLDTQASLTEMLGVQPVLEVGDNETVFGVLRYDDERRPLPEVIRPTYFAGLDLVPGQSELQYFDYETPAAIISNKYVGDEYFIRRLATALRSVEDRYDVVVIDAPPQLSYLTLNAVYAATGLIIPVQSAMIDVASMNQFLYMMDEMLEQMAHFGAPVDHEFMRFLLTRHIPHDVPQVNIAAMLRSLFGESVLTAAVVETTAITNAGLENKTLYELEKGSVGRDTYNRAIESVNAANTEIFHEILKVWGALMNKASNRAKRLAGMFGAVDPNELAKQADAEKSDKATSRPMTTAPTKALQASFASIEEENLRLKAELQKSQTAELDPATVGASIIQDRLNWNDDDPDFQSLVTSIKEEGQRLPILVRPHPTERGRYQLAYGARRNRACMVLGQSVKAYVQELSDEELVIAQGLENNERKNLSFIEQAVYAAALLEAGFTRKLVAKSVGVASDTTISKMSAIVAVVPADIFSLIGAAPKIGRNRWEAFASLAERSAMKPSILEAVRALPESTVWKGADSNKRFELAFRTAEKADKFRTTKPKAEKSRVENEGRSFGTIEQSSNTVKIILDAKNEPAFAQFVADKMAVLIEEFKKREGKKTGK